ncbi:MAG: efflux RND transporter periplasmic adaptor subunit, partial [Methylomonas sp.]|nr:efflux RND transporter periplasmic adaptor subunit [Methylomonas sp.]
MRLIRRIFPLMVISLGILAGVVIYAGKQPAKRKPAKANTLSVETQVLQPERFSPTIVTQGVVEPRTTTTLIPRVSGEVVAVSPNFRPGGFFEKGDVLLTIDSSDYRLNIKSAQAELAEARFNYELERSQAEQAAENWSKLERQQTPSDLVLHKPQLAKAEAAVEAAQAKLQRAELDLQRTRIVAPYAGRILEQFADVGQYVSPGNPLAKIFATDYVEIRLPISEKQSGMLELPSVYAGESARGSGPRATVIATIGGHE